MKAYTEWEVQNIDFLFLSPTPTADKGACDPFVFFVAHLGKSSKKRQDKGEWRGLSVEEKTWPVPLLHSICYVRDETLSRGTVLQENKSMCDEACYVTPTAITRILYSFNVLKCFIPLTTQQFVSYERKRSIIISSLLFRFIVPLRYVRAATLPVSQTAA